MTLPFAERCPVCDGTRRTDVVELADLPVFCNVLWDSEEEARGAARGRIALVACGDCGLVFNRAFDEDLAAYAPGYENSLHFSPTFNEFSRSLAQRLAGDHALAGKTVVEIGAGGGDFLRSLCELSGSRGIGFDPSHDADRQGDPSSPVRIVAEPFPSDGAVGADLVCSRHVFEHLVAPLPVAESVAKALRQRPGSAFYVEVPDCLYMLERLALWDVIYEHCTYFSDPALRYLLERAGMRVTASGRAFGDQYLWAEATADAADSVRPAPAARDIERIHALGRAFDAHVRATLAAWGARLAEMAARGPLAVWGAGSKGVTFLNVLPAGRLVRWVVDVNPRKHGRFVPGTGQQVVGPAALRAEPPATICVMNPLYVDEIGRQAADLGLDAAIVSVTA